MLGWEYPPLINGGLGVACHGLAEALAPHTQLNLIVPHAPEDEKEAAFDLQGLNQLQPETYSAGTLFSKENTALLNRIPISLDPYEDHSEDSETSQETQPREAKQADSYYHAPQKTSQVSEAVLAKARRKFWADLYAGDLNERVRLYSEIVSQLGLRQHFDLIHAHDWMTIPAALELQKLTKKPFVLHVHSTQYDRQGPSDRGWIFEVERHGMQAADQIIAVSQYTAEIIERYYGISSRKIKVVHNGITKATNQARPPKKASAPKTVLFLGRLTSQKGPEFFLDIAQRTLENHPETTFLIAGQGDKEKDLRASIRYRNLQEQIKLVGFLDEAAKEEAFRQSDVLLLPSVSEPFGLSALEAAQHRLPVILSKQSGVREVLTHAPTADYFDISGFCQHLDLLLSDPFHYQGQARNAYQDSQEATWKNAARKLLKIYQPLLSDAR